MTRLRPFESSSADGSKRQVGSQYRLGVEAGLGQLAQPWPTQAYPPTRETLAKLAPIVGRSLGDLMRWAGRGPDDIPPVNQPEDPPELASIIDDIRAAFNQTDPQIRSERIRVTRAVWQIQQPRRRGPESAN